MEVYAQIKNLYKNAEVIFADDTEGKGKGWAVREGFKKSTKDIIVFLDGDMDIEPKEISKLLPLLDKYDIVVGVKNISQLPFRRKILSFLSRKMIKFIFHLPICDTQTGLKAFKRKAISEWGINGYAFDCEILSDAYHKGFTMTEVPIECSVSENKGIKDILKTFWEVIK